MTVALLRRIMKPGLYLLLFLVLTVYRVVQMSVLLARHAMLDGAGLGGGGGGAIPLQQERRRYAAPPSPRSTRPYLPPASGLHATSKQEQRQPSNKSRQPQHGREGEEAAATASPECSDLTAKHLTRQLNDPTIRSSPCLRRPREQRQQNKVKIWLTSFGWNHPNRTLGMTFPRSKRTRELLQAIVDHPDFEPTGWDSYHTNRNNGSNSDKDKDGRDDEDVQHLVFLDVETCHEGNYPVYGRHDLNQDNEGMRPSEPNRWDLKTCYTADNCPAVQSALESPLFASAPNKSNNARLVYLDCKGNGVTEAERGLSSRIAFVSLSSHRSQLDRRRGDQGLPPPVDAAKFRMTPEELRQVDACDESGRPYLLSFVGALRRDSPRDRLVALHDAFNATATTTTSAGGGDTNGVQPQRPIFAMSKADFAKRQLGSDPHLTYESLLRQSLFAAAPRGTNLFSYRFAEAIAMGAIPVVHSDGWVLPFAQEVVNWSECAVVIPERKIRDTPRILGAISAERRCRMRRTCVEIHQRYMSTPAGTVRGILDGLVPRRDS